MNLVRQIGKADVASSSFDISLQIYILFRDRFRLIQLFYFFFLNIFLLFISLTKLLQRTVVYLHQKSGNN